MKLSTHIRPISYLKSHAAEIVKKMSEDHEPMVITQNAEAKLVVMDIQSYKRYEETLALLKILTMGTKQIEDGLSREMDDVFNDLDKE